MQNKYQKKNHKIIYVLLTEDLYCQLRGIRNLKQNNLQKQTF